MYPNDITKTILVKKIYYCLQDILMNDNAESAKLYIASAECKMDCQALKMDYTKLVEWIENPQFVVTSTIPKLYKVSWQTVFKDIKNDVLPTIKRSYRGKKWHYVTLENLIEYDRRL